MCVTHTQTPNQTQHSRSSSRIVARTLLQAPHILLFMLHLDVVSSPARRARPCGAHTSTAARATLDPPRKAPRDKVAGGTMAMLVSLSAIIFATMPPSADALLASPRRDLPRSPEVSHQCSCSQLEVSVWIVR